MKKIKLSCAALCAALSVNLACADFIQDATNASLSAQTVDDRIEKIMGISVDQAVICLHRMQDGSIYRRHSNMKHNGIVKDAEDLQNFNNIIMKTPEGQVVRFQISRMGPNNMMMPVAFNAKIVLSANQGPMGANDVCFVRALAQ